MKPLRSYAVVRGSKILAQVTAINTAEARRVAGLTYKGVKVLPYYAQYTSLQKFQVLHTNFN